MNNVQKINYGPLGAELPKGVSTTYPLATDGDEKGTQKVSTLYTAIQSSFFLPFK